MLTLLFFLIVAHALADYPLQGDFLAQAKNRHTELGQLIGAWPLCLIMHGLIHAGAVMLILHSLPLALLELVLHCLIDLAKNEKKISFITDQALHLACKVLYVAIVFSGVM